MRPDWEAVDTIGVTVMMPAATDPAHQRAGPCRWPPTRRGSCGTASRTRARSPVDLVRRPPGALAAAALEPGLIRARSPTPAPASWPGRVRTGVPSWTLGGTPLVEEAPLPTSCAPPGLGLPLGVPVITDRLPVLGAAPVEPHARPAAVGRVLARPSLPALVGLVVVVVFFGVQAADPAHLGRAGQRPRRRRPAGHRRGRRCPCCSSPASSTCRSACSPRPASLVTALLIEHAGWGTWPALAASLAAPPSPSAVNGFLVVNTGLPSFLVTLAASSSCRASRRPAPRPWPARPGSPGWRTPRWARPRRCSARPCSWGTAASGSRWCGGWRRRPSPGRCGAPLRQRGLRQRRRPPGRPSARRPGPADDAGPVPASPPRPAG